MLVVVVGESASTKTGIEPGSLFMQGKGCNVSIGSSSLFLNIAYPSGVRHISNRTGRAGADSEGRKNGRDSDREDGSREVHLGCLRNEEVVKHC